MLFKVGTSNPILLETLAKVNKKPISPVNPNVKSPVVQNVKEVKQSVHSGHVVEPLDKENFLYFRCRAISAGETNGPNGNGDYFPLEELVKSYKTFVGRGLYLNHDSSLAEKAVGKIIDAYLITDADTREIWVETLCKIDRKANASIARQVETGIIDSVSMGCNCASASCSVCDMIMQSRDEFCEHMKTGLLRKFNNSKNEEVTCYSINRGLTFSELSLVSVPADSKAKIHEVLASLKVKANFDDFKAFILNRGEHLPEHKDDLDQITDISALKDYMVGDGYLDEKGWTDMLEDFVSNSDRTANLKANSEEESKMADEKAEVSKVAGEVDPKQPATKLMTTKDEHTNERAMEPGDKVSKATAEVKTTKEEQDEVKNVLQKLNALEYLNLQEFLSKKAKDMGSEGDVGNLERGQDDSAHEKGRKVEEEKAKKNKANPVDEPALKDMKKDIGSRTAAQEKVAGKEGENYGDEYPDKASGEEELAKMKKEVLRRVESKLATRLFQHVLEKEVMDIAKDPKAAKALLADVTKDLAKFAQAKPGSKEYYYWTGQAEPKPAGISTEAPGPLYTSEHAGEDVTQVRPGSQQSEDAAAQLKETDAKNEWSKATDAKKKREDSQNSVMKTRKSMGFGEAHTAEFKKAEQAKDCRWIVKNAAGEEILDFSLHDAYQDELHQNQEFATSPEYGSAITERISNEGVGPVAKMLNVPILKSADDKKLPPWMQKKDDKGSEKKDDGKEPKKDEHKDEKPKEDKSKKEEKAPEKKKGPEMKPEQKKIMDKLEALESLLGAKKPEGEQEGKSFEDKVLACLELLEAAARKDTKKDAPMGGPGMDKKPPMAPGMDKKPAMPPMNDKPLPKSPFASADENGVTVTAEVTASAFDKGEPIVVGEGITAKKDAESKMIVVMGKDGKEMARYPDAFGDDVASIIKLLGMVLGLEKKEIADKTASQEEKSEREKTLEAELQAEKTKGEIREKSLRARAVIEDMLERGMIEPDDNTMKFAQREGASVFDSRREGLRKAIDNQMSNLFKMDEVAFTAFAKSIRGIRKEAQKRADTMLTKAPVIPTDPLKMGKNDDEWLRDLPWS